MWDVILKKLNVKCNAQPVMLHIKKKKKKKRAKYIDALQTLFQLDD